MFRTAIRSKYTLDPYERMLLNFLKSVDKTCDEFVCVANRNMRRSVNNFGKLQSTQTIQNTYIHWSLTTEDLAGSSPYFGKRLLVMFLSALVMTGLLVTNIPFISAQQQQQTLTICFYVDSPSTPFSPGHGFIQLIDSTNPSSSSQVYGKYPGGWDIFGGNGEIKDDSNRDWDWKICYTVTRAQYNAVVNFITNEIKNPSSYDLLGTNCVSWLQTVAGLVGITLPSTVNRLGIDDPYAFETVLERIENNGSFSGGKVISNTNRVTPVNSPVPAVSQVPQQCSYDGIKQYALADSSAVAEALHLEHLYVKNEPINSSPTVTFRTKANPSDSMIVWDFGDGKFEYQLNSVQHTFENGSYSPSVLIIDADSVVRSFFSINISSGYPSSQIFVNVPPASRTFPYTEGPTPVTPAQLVSGSTGNIFSVQVRVKSDPAGHAQFIGQMPNKLEVSQSPTGSGYSTIFIKGASPWVDVSGTLQPNGSFTASGSGTVAGFPNIMVTFTGTMSSGSLIGDYTMGVGGGLPGGQPIIYSVEGQRIEGVESQPSGSQPSTVSVPAIIPNVKSQTVSLGSSTQFTLDITAPTGFRQDFTIITKVTHQAKNIAIKLFPPISVYDEDLKGYRDVTLTVTPSPNESLGEFAIVLGITYQDPVSKEQVILDELGNVTVYIRQSQEQGSKLSLSVPAFFTPRIFVNDKPAQIPSIVVNDQDVSQPYTYIVLVIDENGYTDFASWVSGSVQPKSKIITNLDWTPSSDGIFSIKTFLWLSMDKPVPLAPAANTSILTSLYQPADERTTPIVSTRGHFDEHVFADPSLTSGHTDTDYDTTGDIPGINKSPCPKEIVIYVHGFQNNERDAIENFDTTKKSLEANGYTNPVIGFSWDSDTGSLDFDDAKMIAEKNGKKLAQFILDFTKKCPDTKIRLIGHSMGARVILNALESLHNNSEWNSKNWKVTSVHLLGAAVDNEEVSKNGGFGNAIEDEAGEFYNKFNYEDNVLSRYYWLEEGDQALGENGAEKGIPLPKNYHEEDVTNDVGDNHSGYNGNLDKNGNLENDGVMDKVVNDWK